MSRPTLTPTPHRFKPSSRPPPSSSQPLGRSSPSAAVRKREQFKSVPKFTFKARDDKLATADGGEATEVRNGYACQPDGQGHGGLIDDEDVDGRERSDGRQQQGEEGPMHVVEGLAKDHTDEEEDQVEGDGALNLILGEGIRASVEVDTDATRRKRRRISSPHDHLPPRPPLSDRPRDPSRGPASRSNTASLSATSSTSPSPSPSRSPTSPGFGRRRHTPWTKQPPPPGSSRTSTPRFIIPPSRSSAAVVPPSTPSTSMRTSIPTFLTPVAAAPPSMAGRLSTPATFRLPSSSAHFPTVDGSTPEPPHISTALLGTIFSPHRRGGPRFVPGGLAGEVRDWVIGMSALSPHPGFGHEDQTSIAGPGREAEVKGEERMAEFTKGEALSQGTKDMDITVEEWQRGQSVVLLSGTGNADAKGGPLRMILTNPNPSTTCSSLGSSKITNPFIKSSFPHRTGAASHRPSSGGEQISRRPSRITVKQPIWDVEMGGEKWVVGVEWMDVS
ncbi:MAG: hypothetical protein M1817_002356 [Caeruleum heppii]|nr:MAG: hypothetical protein M1817_003459 [Caeruleum heppii]KAI9673718.1 MAG: hypothetical protein M1817_002356 [Caeruleum heppii]